MIGPSPTHPPAPALSVIVPAFNEAGLIVAAVRTLRQALDESGFSTEIIVVNDGSHDATGVLAADAARALRDVTVLDQENQGIGGAFRTGATHARGDYLMLWPVDMPASRSTLAPYLQALGPVDVVVGCRRRRVGYNPVMVFNAWLYPKLVAGLFDLKLRDVNWIHVYRRSSFLKITLTQRGIPMLAETLVRLRDLGATFREIDVEMVARAEGVPTASRAIVMIRTLTGLFAFWRVWRAERRLARTS